MSTHELLGDVLARLLGVGDRRRLAGCPMTADAPLTAAERAELRIAVDRDETGDGYNDTRHVFAAVESILLARETALRETIAQEIEAVCGDTCCDYARAARIVRGQA